MRHVISHGGHYLVVVVICALAVRPLTTARWPLRHPALGIATWQALLASVCSAVIGLALSVALAGYGTGELAGLWRLGADVVAERETPLSVAQWAVLGLAVLLAVGLAVVLGRSTAATAAARRRHRHLLDLVDAKTSNRFATLSHPVPVAYCVPGWPPRLVISAGALAILDTHGLEAVLAHERAHAAERHDLVLLPFAALRATRVYAAVALLVECRADDRAARVVGRAALRRALSVFAAHPYRIDRLTRSCRPGQKRTPVLVALVVATVASTPWSLLAYPW